MADRKQSSLVLRYAAPLDRDMDEQAAESHFVMRRVTGALLMRGFGLFQAEPAGRVMNRWITKTVMSLDSPGPLTLDSASLTCYPDRERSCRFSWNGVLRDQP